MTALLVRARNQAEINLVEKELHPHQGNELESQRLEHFEGFERLLEDYTNKKLIRMNGANLRTT